MQLRAAALGIVVIVGCSLIGYGLVTGTEATWMIDVDPVAEDDMDDDTPVIEYDYLDPQMQDKFREGVQSDEFVGVSTPPEQRSVYVHYRDSYYWMTEVHGDASQATMFFSIAGGIGVLLLGFLGWYGAERWRQRRES